MDANTIMQMASDPKNWKKTHKKSYEVYVCRPLPGAQCANKLEGTKYVTDQNKQFIISGTVGETWAIDANKLAKTYTFTDGTPITPKSLSAKCDKQGQMDWQKMKTRSDANINWAMPVPKSVQNFPVQTSWGDTLLANRPGIKHGIGDFLVCTDDGSGHPNLNDVWVVNGEVFPTTYDLHAFSNMFPATVTQAETPKPSKSFIKGASEAQSNTSDESKGKRGAKRVEYQIVGRYMNGKEVIAYHLQSIESGKTGRFTREQVAFLVGRDQITNCTAQVYKDKILLRGKGMNLEDLPVQQEDGELKNTMGKVKKGTTAANAMEQFLIVGSIKSGRNTVGYVLQNAGCGIKRFKRQQVLQLAAQGKIANARVQNYQGKVLLRGVGCSLDQLPSEIIDEPADDSATKTSAKKPEATTVRESREQSSKDEKMSLKNRLFTSALIKAK